MSTKIQVEWRRGHVFELSSKGLNQVEIAKGLQIHESTISRDIQYLRKKAKENIRKYIDERLPEEYEKCLVGLNAILKESWNQAQIAGTNKEKIQALSLAKDCYSMKLELLTNAAVVDEALKFVSTRKEKAKAYVSIISNKEKATNDIQGSPSQDSESDAAIPTNQTF